MSQTREQQAIGNLYPINQIKDILDEGIKRYGDKLECIAITYDVSFRGEPSNEQPVRIIPQLDFETKEEIAIKLLDHENISKTSFEDLGICKRLADNDKYIVQGYDTERYENYFKVREQLVSDCRKLYFLLRKEYPLLRRKLGKDSEGW